MTIKVEFIQVENAGPDPYGPVYTVRIGRLIPEGLCDLEISEKAWKKYKDVCCRIEGFHGWEHKEHFDLMQRIMEPVRGTAVLRTITPMQKSDTEEGRTEPRSNVHELIVVGDVTNALKVLLHSGRSRIMPLILEDAIECSEDLVRQGAARKGAEIRVSATAKLGANL